MNAASDDHDGRYFTEAELGSSGGGVVHWDNLTSILSGLEDGNDDTTYTAGLGLRLNGMQLSAIGYHPTPRDNNITTRG